MAKYVLNSGLYGGVFLSLQSGVTEANWLWAELKIVNNELEHVIFVKNPLEEPQKYENGYWDGSNTKIRHITREEFEKALEEIE